MRFENDVTDTSILGTTHSFLLEPEVTMSDALRWFQGINKDLGRGVVVAQTGQREGSACESVQ